MEGRSRKWPADARCNTRRQNRSAKKVKARGGLLLLEDSMVRHNEQKYRFACVIHTQSRAPPTEAYSQSNTE